MIVIQDVDVDNNTTEIKDNLLKSNFILTGREATVQADVIKSFLFRETSNCNYPMVCTGILVGNIWYGDRPDDGQYTNPFTGEVVNVGKPQVYITLRESWSGLQLILGNWESDLRVELFGNANTGGLSSATLLGQTENNFTYTNTNVAVNFQDETELHIQFTDGIHRKAVLPRVEFQNSLGTFTIEADSVEALLAMFETVED